MTDPLAPSGASLLDLARNHHGDAMRLLEQMVTTESPTGDAEGVNAVSAQVVGMFAAHGAQVSEHTGEWGTHLVLDIPGRGARADAAPVLLVGHSDTVWARGTLEQMPYRVEDGVAYGPGVFDMKAGIVVMDVGLRVAREAGLEHPPVRIIIVGDEEIGSPTSQDLLREVAQGVRAAIGFESPHPDGALKVGRLGSTRVRLSVTGRAAHAALDPESGINAIEELADQIVAIRSIVAAAEQAEAGRSGPGGVLCNVGTIGGGGKANVVPAQAWAEIGLRFRTGEVEQEVLGALQALTPVREGAVLSAELLSNRPAWAPGAGSAELMTLVEQAAEAAGLPEVGGYPAAGAGDTNLLGSLGLPTLDGFGPRGAGAHAVHEQAVVEALDERAALLAGLLARL